METEIVQQNQSQPAISEQPSSQPGPVAPSQQPEQSFGEVPGIPPARIIGQPAEPQQQGVALASQPVPEVDYKSQWEIAEQNRIAAEQQANQYRQTFGQLQSALQQQNQQQALQNQINMVLATAENMSSQEANTYLRNQMGTLVQQQQMTAQQMIQQREQQFEQERKVIAAPLYADHLIQTLGLPPEAKGELLSLGDPDVMYRQAPALKQRYDAWKQQISGLTQGQQQLARTAEVQQIRNAGLANVGGQMGSGSYQLEVSDDPDIAAMQILQHLEQRGAQGR